MLLLLVLSVLVAVAQAFLPTSTLVGPHSGLRPTAAAKRALQQRQRLLPVLMSTSKEGKGAGSKRRRRKSSSGGSAPAAPGSSGGSPSGGGGGGVGRFDPALSNLIEDERRAALPRLEDLKKGKEAAAKGAAALPTGGTPGILLPRELEELKAKERAKAPTKGAPPYFDLMTRASWAGIAVLVIAEVVVQIFRTN